MGGKANLKLHKAYYMREPEKFDSWARLTFSFCRRPFQKGSQDRIYVEEHFPELLPGESKKCEKGVKTRQPARKTQKRDQEHTFGTLPLDKVSVSLLLQRQQLQSEFVRG